jgi:hypothetical protein
VDIAILTQQHMVLDMAWVGVEVSEEVLDPALAEVEAMAGDGLIRPAGGGTDRLMSLPMPDHIP